MALQWNGLPETSEEGKKMLGRLFLSEQWVEGSEASMDHAMAILKAYPELASKNFLCSSLFFVALRREDIATLLGDSGVSDIVVVTHDF